jgi:microsomal dipeptidase-like Zn-dependent dipeptidase
MLCDIARNLEDDKLQRIKALEDDLGLTIVAFSCRSLDPAREERLSAMMAEFGPQLQAEPAEPDEEQLGRIREAEETMGLSLVAVQA